MPTRAELDAKIDPLATRDELDAKIDPLATRANVDAKIDTAVGNFAIMVEKGFASMGKTIEDLRSELTVRMDKMEKYMEDRFDATFHEFQEVKDRIKEIDVRADVVDLQLRVAKLEKKVRL